MTWPLPAKVPRKRCGFRYGVGGLSVSVGGSWVSLAILVTSYSGIWKPRGYGLSFQTQHWFSFGSYHENRVVFTDELDAI